MNLRPESRIKALEKRATRIEGAIEELADDTAQELKAIRQDIKQLDERMQSGFLEIGTLFDRNFRSFDTIEARLDRIESDISGIKDTMATKDDIASIKATQEQILQLLQQKQP